MPPLRRLSRQERIRNLIITACQHTPSSINSISVDSGVKYQYIFKILNNVDVPNEVIEILEKYFEVE